MADAESSPPGNSNDCTILHCFRQRGNIAFGSGIVGVVLSLQFTTGKARKKSKIDHPINIILFIELELSESLPKITQWIIPKTIAILATLVVFDFQQSPSARLI